MSLHINCIDIDLWCLLLVFTLNLIMNSSHNLKPSAHQPTKHWQVSFYDSGYWGSARWKKIYSSEEIHQAENIAREEFPGSQIIKVDKIGLKHS